MTLTIALVALLLNAAVVGAGIYLAAYLKKKAEHLATREEFKDLQTQTAELTRTTKEIEAKISDDVWNRQRRWELKRDLLLEMVKKTSAVHDALTSVYAIYQIAKIGEKTGDVLPEPTKSKETKARAHEKWSSTFTEFDTVVSQVALVCSPELTKALRDFAFHMGITYQNTTQYPGEYLKAMPEYLKEKDALQAMIRKELGIDPPGQSA